MTFHGFNNIHYFLLLRPVATATGNFVKICNFSKDTAAISELEKKVPTIYSDRGSLNI